MSADDDYGLCKTLGRITSEPAGAIHLRLHPVLPRSGKFKFGDFIYNCRQLGTPQFVLLLRRQ